MESKTRINFFITKKQLSCLRQVAKTTDLSVAALIRYAIERYLDTKDRPEKKGV